MFVIGVNHTQYTSNLNVNEATVLLPPSILSFPALALITVDRRISCYVYGLLTLIIRVFSPLRSFLL